MEGGMVCNTLADELVERIISMVPYPSIFKARLLSKSWLARLSSTCSVEDEGKKRLATSFQKLVRERSKRWPIYCPVLMKVKDLGLIGWQQGNNKWQNMPTLSFVPKTPVTRLSREVDGALMLVTRCCGLPHDGEMYVANILTRTCKRLTPPPATLFKIDAVKLVVVDESSESYKVILLYSTEESDDYDDCMYSIYDSRSHSWTRGDKILKACALVRRSLANFVQFKGILYIMADCNPPKLWAFDLKGGAVEELELSIGDGFDYPEDANFDYHCLVVCGTDLVMVYFCELFCIGINAIHILKVDLQTLTLVPLAKGPPQDVGRTKWADVPVTDGYNIYLGMGNGENEPILKYEIGKDTWSSLDPTCTDRVWTNFCFRPGRGAFMAV